MTGTQEPRMSAAPNEPPPEGSSGPQSAAGAANAARDAQAATDAAEGHTAAPVADATPSSSEEGKAYASCPGRELQPNPCCCPCYGCKHHCAAHQPPDDTDLTEADIDRMMADGVPVQIVNGPPPTYGAPAPCSGCRYVPCGNCAPAPEPGLREQVAEAIGLHRNGPASDGRGWYRNDEDRTECHAIADAVLNIRDAELAQLRAELAARDAAIGRVHAELIRLCREPHPSHDHLCPDDVRRTILNALDQPQEEP